ncbi:class I SAM-dependent methyltransferase [Ramlibacter rhizophilus]
MPSVFPAVSPSDVARWDREWMQYFATEDPSPHLIESRKLSLVCSDLARLSQAEVYGTVLTGRSDGAAMTPLRIWVKGADLVGKRVLEIGCGCGWLGKQLGLVCESYTGIDYSQFALAVARGSSPPNCRYFHISEHEDIARLQGQLDTLVGREFFIHQNFDNASWVLGLAAFLLRSGGIVSADFYLPNPAIPQGVVHRARSPLDPTYASCAFTFEPQEIAEVASRAGLVVQSITDDPHNQRRFATLQKA